MLGWIVGIAVVAILYGFLKRVMDGVYAKRDRQSEYYDAKMRCQRKYPRIKFSQFSAWYEVNPESWDMTRLKSHAIVTKNGDADMTYSMRYKDYVNTLNYLDRREKVEWEFYSYGKLAKAVADDVHTVEKVNEAKMKEATRTYEEVVERMREQ